MDRGKNWKKQIRVRGRYKPSTALTSLAERPVFSLRRREFFPSARAEKPRKTADYSGIGAEFKIFVIAKIRTFRSQNKDLRATEP